MPHDPTWAILAPVTPDRLRKAIDDTQKFERLQLRRGRSRYSAVVDYEPGTEYSGERELASELSRQGTVYIGYFSPPWITVLAQGAVVEEREGDPYALGLQLECPLTDREPLMPPTIKPDQETHVLVVLNATPEGVARFYKQPWPLPVDSTLALSAGPRGVVVQKRGADLTTRAPSLSAALSTTVYACEIYRSGGLQTAFRCQIFDRGQDRGSFDDPHTDWSEPNTLRDIFGATTAQEIMRQLGV